MFTDGCVRIDPRLTTQRFNHIQRNDTPELSFTGGTVNCLPPFYFQLTGSSGWFGDMIILTARFSFPNPPKSVLFFFPCLFSPIYISLYSFLWAALFLPQSHCFYSPYYHSVLLSPSSSPLRGSGIRGIPEGDFPCFRLSVWPLKTVYCQRLQCKVFRLTHVTQYKNFTVNTPVQMLMFLFMGLHSSSTVWNIYKH